MQPAVIAVVLNLNAEDDTAACLASLLASDYPALTVLLVDNGSPDGSGERLRQRFPAVAYVQTGANIGFTGGNNRGIEWALAHGAEYVLVINNDTVVDGHAVSALVEAASRGGRVGGVAPKILYFAEPNRIWYGGGRFVTAKALGTHLREGLRDDAHGDEAVERVSFLTGCCILLSATALREVGSFAEDFFIYVEDTELSVRLARAGYDLLYQPAARILHRIPPGRGRDGTFQIVLRDRNRRRLVRRHYRWPERALFAAWFYPTRLIHLARYVARGDLARARAIVTGMSAP